MSAVFAIAGLVSALVLCLIDFITSYHGVRAVIPEGNDSWILKITPVLFAVLALTFNGTSAHLFRHFRRGRFGGVATLALLAVWLNFLAYDWITSFAGVVAEFAGRPLGSVEAIWEAYMALSLAQQYVATVIAILASAGPFLASAFSDLAAERWREAEERAASADGLARTA